MLLSIQKYTANRWRIHVHVNVHQALFIEQNAFVIPYHKAIEKEDCECSSATAKYMYKAELYTKRELVSRIAESSTRSIILHRVVYQ